MLLENTVPFQEQLRLREVGKTMVVQTRDRFLSLVAIKSWVAKAGLYKDLMKLDSHQLRDIGLEDPEIQKQRLGRYLDTRAANCRFLDSRSSGLAGITWHY